MRQYLRNFSVSFAIGVFLLVFIFGGPDFTDIMQFFSSSTNAESLQNKNLGAVNSLNPDQDGSTKQLNSEEQSSGEAKAPNILNTHEAQASETLAEASEKPAQPKKVAYLSFDDGPSPEVTTQILDIAQEYNIKVTFFVLGLNVDRYPEIVKRAHAEGHSIGNHSYSHKYKTIYQSAHSLMLDVNRCSEALEIALGYRPGLFRAPGGSVPYLKNAHVQWLEEAGLEYFDWNVCPGDAEGTPKTARTLIDNVLKQSKGKDRIMVLMHDSTKMRSTAQALPEIIEGLQEMGFTFEIIDENTEPIKFNRRK